MRDWKRRREGGKYDYVNVVSRQIYFFIGIGVISYGKTGVIELPVLMLLLLPLLFHFFL